MLGYRRCYVPVWILHSASDWILEAEVSVTGTGFSGLRV